jgi:hypothetical protein
MIVELRGCDVRYSTPRLELVQPQENRPPQCALLRMRRNVGAGPSHAGEPFVALVFPIASGAVRQEIYFGQIFYVFVT